MDEQKARIGTESTGLDVGGFFLVGGSTFVYCLWQISGTIHMSTLWSVGDVL